MTASRDPERKATRGPARPEPSSLPELLRQVRLTLLFTAAGIAIVLIPMLDTRDRAFPEGRTVVLVAGLVFALFGVLASVGTLRALARRSRGLAVLGALALSMLLLPPVWIALARGVFPGPPPPPVFEPVRLSVDPGVAAVAPPEEEVERAEQVEQAVERARPRP